MSILPHVTSQVAGGDIYNVSGNLVMNVDRIVIDKLSISDGHIQASANSIENSIIATDYNKALDQLFAKKVILRRNKVLAYVENMLLQNRQLILFGEPGIGKTCLLNDIAKKYKSIYISVKDKPSISIYRYLLSKVLLEKNKLKEIPSSEEEVLNLFEYELQETNLVFLIDDTEKNQMVAKRLLSIEAFSNKFILASRTKYIAGQHAVQAIEISPFDENEIVSYLEIAGIDKTRLNVIELAKASKGNPLYLYYFSRYQVYPYPIGLEAYQDSLWYGLTLEHQSILSILSIAPYPLDLDALAFTLGQAIERKYSSITVLGELDFISHLLKVVEGRYELFHPIFQEYLCDSLSTKGVDKEYRKILGEYFLNNDEIAGAVWLLVDIDDEKIKTHLLDVVPEFIRMGAWDTSIKILNKTISMFADDLIIKGYSYYHLTNCYRHLGKGTEALESIEISIQAFEKAGDQNWLSAALMFKAIELAEDGLGDDAVVLANQVIDNISDESFAKATALVNLSNIFIKVSRCEDAARVAKEAFVIFDKIKDYKGIVCSLTNLSTCLAELDDLDNAVRHLEMLKEIVQVENDLVSLTVVLNSLTLCYRRLGNYKLAKEHGEMAIKLCSELNLQTKVVMNLINLGNVYRDEENLIEAERLYLEGLSLAKACGYKKEEGRALELLANIKNESGDAHEALKYAKEAVKKSLDAKDFFRCAEACREESFAEYQLEDYLSAASSYERAIEYYLKVGANRSIMKTYCLAAECYLEAKSEKNAKRIIDRILDNLTYVDDFNFIDNMLVKARSTFDEAQILDVYKKVISFVMTSKRAGIPQIMTSYVSLCKSCKCSQGVSDFHRTLNELIKYVASKDWRVLVLLLIIIEQSGSLLETRDLESLSKSLSEKLPGFHFRLVGTECVSALLAWENGVLIQINTFNEPVITYKLFFVFILIVQLLEYFLQDEIKVYKHKEMEIWLFSLSDFEKNIQEVPETDKDLPAIFLMRADYDAMLPVIIHDDYEKLTDYKLNQSPALVSIVAPLFSHILAQLTHTDPYEDEVRERTKHFVRSILGVQDKSLWIKGSQVSIDLGDVQQCLEKMSRT